MRALYSAFMMLVSYLVGVVSTAHIPTDPKFSFVREGNSSLFNAVNVTG